MGGWNELIRGTAQVEGLTLRWFGHVHQGTEGERRKMILSGAAFLNFMVILSQSMEKHLDIIDLYSRLFFRQTLLHVLPAESVYFQEIKHKTHNFTHFVS